MKKVYKNVILLLLFISNNIVNAQQINDTNNDAIFAVYKLSYKTTIDSIGIQTNYHGVIFGTGFLLNDSTVCTANHVVEASLYEPTLGYDKVQIWLLRYGGKEAIEINKNDIVRYAKVDIAHIKLKQKLVSRFIPLGTKMLKPGDTVSNIAFDVKVSPQINLQMGAKKNIIKNYNLDSCLVRTQGVIRRIASGTINDLGSRIVLLNKLMYEVDFKVQQGYSGSPLISNNKVIGVLSFGIPAASFVKDKTYVISSSEMLKHCR